jgi:putative tryptophan/tyrosine transport system substrate-binding protein
MPIKAKILVYALLSLILATIHLAEAQQPKKVPRIGFLSAVSSASTPRNRIEAFQQGLRKLGYVEREKYRH